MVKKDNSFPIWLRTRLLSAGLEPVLSQTEKLCTATNYRQSMNIKIKIIKLIPFCQPVFYRSIFHFDIRGKLSIIRRDKYII